MVDSNKKYRESPRGRANKTWHKILQRIGNKDGKNPSYENIKLRMTQQEFMEWSIPLYKKWSKDHPFLTPAINRIDPKGHYEIKNLEIISHKDNSLLGLQNAWKTTRTPLTEEDLASKIIKKCRHHKLDLEEVCKILLTNLSKINKNPL